LIATAKAVVAVFTEAEIEARIDPLVTVFGKLYY